MNIVIMCAGKSKRFGTHKPKCLAEILGVPNLERTINMLWRLGQYEIKITCPHDKKYYFDSYSGKVLLVEGHNVIGTQRFSNAFPLTERTVYLYGDVVYSLKDLELILELREVTTWYGKMNMKRELKNNDELMAVQVIDVERFQESVLEVERQFRNGKRKQAIGWDVYEVHEELVKRIPSNFTQLKYSDDYDTQKQLKQLNLILINNERNL